MLLAALAQPGGGNQGSSPSARSGGNAGSSSAAGLCARDLNGKLSPRECAGSDGCLLGKKMALGLKRQQGSSQHVDHLWITFSWVVYCGHLLHGVGWPVLLAGQPSVCLLILSQSGLLRIAD